MSQAVSKLETVGKPDGPLKSIAALGQIVGTFVTEPGGKGKALMHHVPFDMRGPFRPKDLANYDPNVNYRCDSYGYVLCYSKTKSDNRCIKRAVNRINRCDIHGGRLHPLDKVKKSNEEYEAKTGINSLERYQQFMAGQIGPEDLDDEELATGSFRGPNGKLYRPKNLPASVIKEFHRAIYTRAEDGLRAGVAIAADVVVSIAKNTAVEPADRIKAATILLDRGLGKTPDKVNVNVESKGFENLLNTIAHVTREESQRQRGLIVDAEVVEDNERAPSILDLPVESGTEQEKGLSTRTHSRHPAVMAQEIAAIRPFEYDTSDPQKAIEKARNKRYAANKLGVAVEDLGHQRFQFEFLSNGDGTAYVKITDPTDIRTPVATVKKEKRKRKFDF